MISHALAYALTVPCPDAKYDYGTLGGGIECCGCNFLTSTYSG